MLRHKVERKDEFEKTLTQKDFLKEDVLCDKTNKKSSINGIGGIDVEGFTVVGEKQVEGSMQYMIGHRKLGRFYCKLYDTTPVQVHGIYKITLVSATRMRQRPIIIRNSRNWNDDEPTNLGKNPTLNAGIDTSPIWVTEDGYVQLLFKPETDGITVDYDNTNNFVIVDYIEKTMK